MEVEVKLRLPGPEAHSKLEQLLAPGLVATHQQENYFFDGPGGELNSRRVVLRLRFYDADRRAVLTLKGEQVLVDGIARASEEEETLPDAAAARAYLVQPSALLDLDSDIIRRLARQYGLTALVSLGGFENTRQEVAWEGFTLELDATRYEWGTLYELEAETDKPEALRARLEALLQEQDVAYSYSSTSKFANFIQRTLVPRAWPLAPARGRRPPSSSVAAAAAGGSQAEPTASGVPPSGGGEASMPVDADAAPAAPAPAAAAVAGEGGGGSDAATAMELSDVTMASPRKAPTALAMSLLLLLAAARGAQGRALSASSANAGDDDNMPSMAALKAEVAEAKASLANRNGRRLAQQGGRHTADSAADLASLKSEVDDFQGEVAASAGWRRALLGAAVAHVSDAVANGDANDTDLSSTRVKPTCWCWCWECP
ncbi:TTM3 [Scenedesmus sp. PABB004]|nr:TTM3 [Scenedesmus sp. PABB004]KAF8054829.1 TTM3 [Scenedesmus sp. PABB004]KAF8068146.1 TTM3 [Scenedesmus sp. PABB004]